MYGGGPKIGPRNDVGYEPEAAVTAAARSTSVAVRAGTTTPRPHVRVRAPIGYGLTPRIDCDRLIQLTNLID